MFVLDPVLVALVHPGYQGQSFFVYIGEHLPDVSILGHTGPMWFALALLIFSVILVLMRGMMPAPSTVEEFSPHRWVWLGLALGVVSFLVRLVQPVGSSILNMQLCYFTQYVVLFALGVVASRRNILEAIATSKASWRAGLFGVLGGPVLLLLVLISLMPLNKDSANAVNGGWNYHALASAVWEQVTGVGLCLGAIWLFRQKLSLKTPLSTWLSDRSFAVYLIHPVVLVSLCYWVQPWRGDAILMSLLTTVGALAASFGLADMLRRIPGLRWVL
jgi:peptidoglycan/LPS O-acetylase OafA/YrhL